ncbi:hypothetical protein AWC11_07370 [Mycobacterium interjectum]|nr:hypothetical protein AWC11_07370 [Mycobacterium interjectum]
MNAAAESQEAVAAPGKLVPKQGRIATLETEVAKLREECAQVRWCFMEFLYYQVLAAKSAQAQQLLADPAVRKQLGIAV